MEEKNGTKGGRRGAKQNFKQVKRASCHPSTPLALAQSSTIRITSRSPMEDRGGAKGGREGAKAKLQNGGWVGGWVGGWW